MLTCNCHHINTTCKKKKPRRPYKTVVWAIMSAATLTCPTSTQIAPEEAQDAPLGKFFAFYFICTKCVFITSYVYLMTTNGHGSLTQYCRVTAWKAFCVTTSTRITCPLPRWTTHITQQDEQATMAHWSKLDKLGLNHGYFFCFHTPFFLFTNSLSTVRPWVLWLQWWWTIINTTTRLNGAHFEPR